MNRSRVIDAAASSVHFVDHIAPVWRALPAERRGRFVTSTTQAHRRAMQLGIRPAPRGLAGGQRPVIVASFGDLHLTRGRPFLMIEHGSGQSYGGEPPAGTTPDFGHSCRMLAIACPNERTAYRNRLHHPHAAVEIVGTPKLDGPCRQPRPGNDEPVVAFVWHWANRWICPESNWAYPHWADALATLTEMPDRGYRIVGHGHPRAINTLRGAYRRMGVACVDRLEDVWSVADVVVFDNTSAGWESAAVGCPVVLLDQPAYRRDVEHGLRFWEWADAGVRCGSGTAAELHEAITETLRGDPARRTRLAAVDDLYPMLDGNAAARAADLFTSTAP